MSILREELITNHLLLDYFDMWDEFDITKVNDPKTIRYYDLIMNLINNQIDAGIKWLDSDDARDYFFSESEYQQEVFRSLEDEWDSILEGKYNSVDALLSEVYRRGKAQGYADMREHIQYTEQDKLALEFVTNYNFGLIHNIDYDTRSQIKSKITEAAIAGEHPYTVAPKILKVVEEKLDGSNFTPRQRATMIARTEISRVQNTGILQSYVNEGYTEVKILTAEDDDVCTTCLKYAFEFNKDEDITFENRGRERVHTISKLIKDGKFPPFHPLCRCTYLSVWKDGEKYDVGAEIIDLISYAPNSSNNQNFSKSAIQEFNELKDDPNIEWSIDERVNFNRQGLYNHEPFIRYRFKDTGLVVYKSIFNDVASVKEIVKFYNNLPKELTSVCKELVLSHQMIEREIKGELKYIGGFTKRSSLDKIYILNKPNCSSEDIERIIIHELAHTIDGKNFQYSKKEVYESIFNEDLNELKKRKIYKGNALYVSPYSNQFTNDALNGGKGEHRPYSEDFAECVVEYIKRPEVLFKMFPKKAEYINNILHKYNQKQISRWVECQ